MRSSVKTFKHEYIGDPWVNRIQISYELSSGSGKGCIRCVADRISTLVFMATDNFNMVIIGKMVFVVFLASFDPILFILAAECVTKTCMESWNTSNFGQVGPVAF